MRQLSIAVSLAFLNVLDRQISKDKDNDRGFKKRNDKHSFQ